MKNNTSWQILTAVGIAAAVSFTTLTAASLQAQESRPERKGLFSRLRQNRDQTPPTPPTRTAAQGRTEIDTSRTATKPAPAATPVATPKPTPKPAATPTDSVARERVAGEVPAAAPVATPVASRPPAAVAEPVARPVPGAPQTMQAAESTTPAGASPAAAPKASPISLLANAEPPEPKDLEPKFDKERPPKADGPVMEITSNESILHNDTNERMVEFTGEVFLDHPAFNMSSDRLEVFLNDDAEDPATAKEGDKKPPFKRAIATGAMVKIIRINPQGETEVAFARRADFDGITGDVVLSGGPPELQTGKMLVETDGPDAKIFLLANGQYSVKGSKSPNAAKGPTSRIVIPVKGDNATKAPGFLPTNLNDMKSDRSRE